MNDQDVLDLLGRVERVDPPPFLFTRIEARIAHRRPVVAPRGWVAAAAAIAAIVLVMNVFAIRNATRGRESDVAGNIAVAFGINTSNQLYR